MLNDDSKLIRLAGIAENSLVNGKGLRKVFFSQGCSHHCEGCFNQHTWEFAGGRMFDMDELVQKVKDEPFLDGVTFSGGDPFQQADKFAYLAKKLHEANINIWAYTGYTFEELIQLDSVYSRTLKANNITNPLQKEAVKTLCKIH